MQERKAALLRSQFAQDSCIEMARSIDTRNSRFDSRFSTRHERECSRFGTRDVSMREEARKLHGCCQDERGNVSSDESFILSAFERCISCDVRFIGITAIKLNLTLMDSLCDRFQNTLCRGYTVIHMHKEEHYT